MLPDWAVVLTGSVLVAFAAFCFIAAVWRELSQPLYRACRIDGADQLDFARIANGEVGLLLSRTLAGRGGAARYRRRGPISTAAP